MHLPDSFIENVHRVFGDKGLTWLPQLPDILAQCRDKWGLAEGVASPHMSMNYIEFTRTADGTPVAPHSESFTEMEALGLFGGKHAARLLDTDRVLGAILMQHVQPGTMLWQLEDNQKETEIAASVMKSLTVSVPATHDLPAFSQWVERAFRLTRTTWDPDERMPRHLLERAEQAFAKIQQRPEAEGGSAWRSAS